MKQFYSAYPNLNALRAELSSDFIESEKYNKPQMNADERRLIVSVHRKGREERKAQQHKCFYKYKIIRPGTRMTRIGRISTDNGICAYPCNPCHPCAIGNADRLRHVPKQLS